MVSLSIPSAYYIRSCRVSHVKCLDKCFFKVGADSHLNVELSSVSELNFCHKFQVFCIVCGWSLSCGRITPLSRRLGYFFWWPITDFSVVKYFSVLTVLQEVYQQHTWVLDNGGHNFDSRWYHLKLLPVHGWWLTGQIHISSPLTTHFRQLFPCIA